MNDSSGPRGEGRRGGDREGGRRGSGGGKGRGGKPSGGPRRGKESGERRRGEEPGDRRRQGAFRPRDQRGTGGRRTEKFGRDRREARPGRGPVVPDDITPDQLDGQVRAGLRALPAELADVVARHLVATERLLPEDPDAAYEHAKVARRLAARVGVVREAAGVVAYYAGQWADALSDLRAARRLTGVEGYLPMMADCERGLGRPERALEMARSPEAARLARRERAELAIVASGARADLGELDAAVLALKIPELRTRGPWSPRLFYAYAEALLRAGRGDEAAEWFARAAAVDEEEETDAVERHAELVGGVIVDAAEDEGIQDAEEAG